jgi:hypothetical protein
VKRSEALRSLSREHHQVVSIGRDLGRADDPELAAAKFPAFWELAEAPSLAAVRQLGGDLVAHVRFEERELSR